MLSKTHHLKGTLTLMLTISLSLSAILFSLSQSQSSEATDRILFILTEQNRFTSEFQARAIEGTISEMDLDYLPNYVDERIKEYHYFKEEQLITQRYSLIMLITSFFIAFVLSKVYVIERK